MNECIDHDIREQLPDLLHQTLGAIDRERVERHMASCESCREELAVLRAVQGAAIFAPAIDVAQIVRRIPPYRRIMPPAETPVHSRVPRWLVTAAAAVLVVTGGSLMLSRQTVPVRTAAPSVREIAPTGADITLPKVMSPKPAVTEPAAPAHTYALASDASGLSDGDLVQLMNDMDDFDALPSSDPEPMLPVDSGDSL